MIVKVVYLHIHKLYIILLLSLLGPLLIFCWTVSLRDWIAQKYTYSYYSIFAIIYNIYFLDLIYVVIICGNKLFFISFVNFFIWDKLINLKSVKFNSFLLVVKSIGSSRIYSFLLVGKSIGSSRIYSFLLVGKSIGSSRIYSFLLVGKVLAAAGFTLFFWWEKVSAAAGFWQSKIISI